MATPIEQEYQVYRMRVPLPCEITVLPGTSINDAPVDLRTERCSVDAFWTIGQLPTCDLHLRKVCDFVGWKYDGIVRTVLASRPDLHLEIPNADERKPWNQQHRYPQKSGFAT